MQVEPVFTERLNGVSSHLAAGVVKEGGVWELKRAREERDGGELVHHLYSLKWGRGGDGKRRLLRWGGETIMGDG